MPTPTYVALAKTVLTGTQLEVSFTGIASTYTDLVILCSTRDSGGGTNYTIDVRLNGNTNFDFSTTSLEGNGTAAGTSKWSAVSIARSGMSTDNSQTANTFGNSEIYFPNYAGSTNKVISSTGVSEYNSASGPSIRAFASLKSATTAITSIQLRADTGFVSGSRFDLYGIKNS